MCYGPLKFMSGIGLASQAIKKGGPLAAISPAAALIGGSGKKKPQAQTAPATAISPYGG
jgi:hypothetical protein